ncbi:MAG: DUF2058 domain-containing protein [Fluviicoccus sp.]|uniref:DUF2058 domain-containing protein n=1 Tax=Fluviicoccus sp. TaxID=2003552 RepID=UPI00271CEA3B|nr:DUF2058 domain-containing protein [Fluviicoccus sp.]MDO8330738.1 DUF2058 domain-containing protein [Fluviicoccus sp.]
MNNSLKNQLLKAGLSDVKKVKKLEHEKRVAVDKEESKKLAQKALEEKQARDRELNRLQQLERESKAREAQVRNMVVTQAISRKGGETAYQFADGGKIKKLYVTEAQFNQLVKGQIAVVRSGEGYELVPTLAAEKIRTRDESVVVVLNTRVEKAEVDEEDPYKDYVIPDDLMW